MQFGVQHRGALTCWFGSVPGSVLVHDTAGANILHQLTGMTPT